jgi:hypothetical protein
MKTLLSLAAIFLCACADTGSAPRLQAHLAAAQTGATRTGQKIKSAKSHLDTSDYKETKAKGILNQGVERPQ